jgi:tetratricopeptide (TPR) repeat protein
MRRWLGYLALALAAALALPLGVGGLAACRTEPGASGCPSAEPGGKPIDSSVMAFLSIARARHHKADMREKSGDVPGAIVELEPLVAMQAPAAVEVDEVLADTHARLAELRLASNDLDGAKREVEAGLLRARSATYFRGHLLEVEGLVEEARAARLADAGHADEAAGARTRAMALLEEAVRVQQQVIEQALPGDGGSR